MEIVFIPAEIRNCVCFVYAKYGDNDPHPVGTAFFLAVPLGDTGRYQGFVVSALHVIANVQMRGGRTLLRVNTHSGAFGLEEIPENQWVRPDQSVEFQDIIVTPWYQGREHYDFNFVTPSDAATSEVMTREQLGIGNEVFFAGLFVGHFGQRRNEPIVRTGTVCSMPVEPVSMTFSTGTEVAIHAYLVESRSVGGLSGSPVFIDVGMYKSDASGNLQLRSGSRAWYLLGVMNGHWDAPQETAIVAQGNNASDDDTVAGTDSSRDRVSTEYVNMGVAVVTPIDKVLKMLDESPLRDIIAQWQRTTEEGLRAQPNTHPDTDANAAS